VIVKDEEKQWTNHPLIKSGLELLVLPSGTRLEVAKQRILDESGTVHVISDDDLGIHVRQYDGSSPICSYKDILDLFGMIAHYTLEKGYAHGGISSLQCHNAALVGNPDAVLVNARVGGWHHYNSEVLRKEKIDYTMCPLAEDIFTQLTLLKRGHPNVQFWKYAYDQKTQAAGGCSIYRSLESINQSARTLQKLHPDCIKLTPKYSKVWNGEVMSITAYYKRAFKTSDNDQGEEEEEEKQELYNRRRISQNAKRRRQSVIK
jgi:hypothetical protein